MSGQVTVKGPRHARHVYDPYKHLDFGEYTHKDFPKILYHPEGKTKIIMPGNLEVTENGREVLNRHVEVITCTAADAAELSKLQKEGWHLTLAEAQAAAEGKPGKAKTSGEISGLGK